MQNFKSKLVSVAEQVGLSQTRMETPRTSFLRMWPIFEFGLVVQEEMSFRFFSYLELWRPLCSSEQNHLCNFGTGHH